MYYIEILQCFQTINIATRVLEPSMIKPSISNLVVVLSDIGDNIA